MCFDPATVDESSSDYQEGYQDWYVPGPYTGASVKDTVTVENLPSPSQAAAIQAAIEKNEAKEAEAIKAAGGTVIAPYDPNNPYAGEAVTMYGSGDPKLKSSWDTHLPETWLPDPGTAPDVGLHPDSGWRQAPFNPNREIWVDGGDTHARVDMGAGGHGIKGGVRDVWMGNYSNEFSRDMNKYWVDPETGIAHDTSKEAAARRVEQQRSLNENPEPIEIKQRQTANPKYNAGNRARYNKDEPTVVDKVAHEAGGGDDGNSTAAKIIKFLGTTAAGVASGGLALPAIYGGSTLLPKTIDGVHGPVSNPWYTNPKEAALKTLTWGAPLEKVFGLTTGAANIIRGGLNIAGKTALGDDPDKTQTGGTFMDNLTNAAGPLAPGAKSMAESIRGIFSGDTREKGLSTTLNMTAPQQRAMGAHFNKAPNTPFGDNEAEDFYDRQKRNDDWKEQARWQREQER